MSTTLIDMTMSPEEVKEETQPQVADQPKYPWGLCLTLNDDVLDKLGVGKLPESGTVVRLLATAEVTSVRTYDTQGGEKERSVELQITNMQVEGLDKSIFDRAQELFAGSGQK